MIDQASMTENEFNAGDRNAAWREALRKSMKAKDRTSIPRVPMNELDPAYRIRNKEEVNQGLKADQAVLESKRCLDCANPTCITGCLRKSVPAGKAMRSSVFLYPETAKACRGHRQPGAICCRL